MKTINNLHDLMLEQLRDLYDGEVHALDRLPDVAAYAMDGKLRKVLNEYVHARNEELMRIRQVFELQFEQKRGERCDGLKTMMQDTIDLVQRCPNPEVRNAALITSLQHIIHYKIAGYGAACTYAKTLGLWDEAAILHKNLDDEKHFDRALATIAEFNVNAKAAFEMAQ